MFDTVCVYVPVLLLRIRGLPRPDLISHSGQAIENGGVSNSSFVIDCEIKVHRIR